METEKSTHETESAACFAGPLLRPTEALDGGIVNPPLEADEAAAGATTLERLAMHIGSLRLLCAPDVGREVLAPPPASRLPNMPEWLLGVANVRGALVPVLDLATAFGVERDNAVRGYMLIAGSGDDAVGLLVDGLPILRRFEISEKLLGIPPHPEALQSHVIGAFEREGAVWIDVDIRGLLGALGDRIGSMRG